MFFGCFLLQLYLGHWCIAEDEIRWMIKMVDNASSNEHEIRFKDEGFVDILLH